MRLLEFTTTVRKFLLLCSTVLSPLYYLSFFAILSNTENVKKVLLLEKVHLYKQLYGVPFQATELSAILWITSLIFFLISTHYLSKTFLLWKRLQNLAKAALVFRNRSWPALSRIKKQSRVQSPLINCWFCLWSAEYLSLIIVCIHP